MNYHKGTLYDFHVHTNCSDGNLTPADVVRMSIRNGLNAIAITDHYTLAGIDYAKQVAGSELTVIPGIELSAQSTKSRKVHVVGLYVNKSIYSTVDTYDTNRKIMVKKIITKLREVGYKIEYADILRWSRYGHNVGRFDIALALANMQYAKTPQEAYEKILLQREIYVEREKMSVEEIIRAIKAAGGVPILAHPNSCGLRSESFEKYVEKFVGFGLSGIEVFTPRIEEKSREKLLDICEKYNLITGAGSDFHKMSFSPKAIQIGSGIEGNLGVGDSNILRAIKKEHNRIRKQK